MVFAAKAAADMGELGIDAGRLELAACLAEQVRDCRSGFVRRLGTQHEFEFLAAGVVPGEAGFGFEGHRVDGLGLEFAVEHQERKILRVKLGADLLAVNRGCDIGLPRRDRERLPSGPRPS